MRIFTFAIIFLVFVISFNTCFGSVSITDLKSKINRSGEEGTDENSILQFLVKHLGNEKIAINFLEDNKSLFVVMENAKVVNISEGSGDGTVELNFKNIKVFEGLTNEEISFKQAFKDKDVTIKGLTFGNKIKLGILNLILRIGFAFS